MILLYHDISTRTGWAFGKPGSIPLFGSFRVAQKHACVGEFLDGYEHKLGDQISRFRPDWFAFEAAILRSKKGGKQGTSIETALKLMSLAGIAEKVAWQLRVPNIRQALHQSVALFFTGRGSWPGGREEGKRQSIRVCHELGWQVMNDDEADACAGWSFMCSLIAPAAPLRRWEGALLGVGNA